MRNLLEPTSAIKSNSEEDDSSNSEEEYEDDFEPDSDTDNQ
jgi:hypothetical protein